MEDDDARRIIELLEQIERHLDKLTENLTGDYFGGLGDKLKELGDRIESKLDDVKDSISSIGE